MRQSRFRWLGVLEFVIAGALLAAFGPRMLAAEPTVALFFVSAALLVLAGSVAAVSLGSRTVTWRHLVGAAYLAFAAMWPLMHVPDVLAAGATTEDLVMFGAAAVTMACLAFFAIDIARDGRHFDVTGDVDRVLSL